MNRKVINSSCLGNCTDIDAAIGKKCVLAKKPKVTVGLVVKNCEDTIKETIYSVINQDFPCGLVELIIVDAYSKDRTISILKAALK